MENLSQEKKIETRKRREERKEKGRKEKVDDKGR